jgi:hypothetical protein
MDEAMRERLLDAIGLHAELSATLGEGDRRVATQLDTLLALVAEMEAAAERRGREAERACACGGKRGYYPEADPDGNATGREAYCTCPAGRAMCRHECGEFDDT